MTTINTMKFRTQFIISLIATQLVIQLSSITYKPLLYAFAIMFGACVILICEDIVRHINKQ